MVGVDQVEIEEEDEDDRIDTADLGQRLGERLVDSDHDHAAAGAVVVEGEVGDAGPGLDLRQRAAYLGCTSVPLAGDQFVGFRVV